VGHLVVNYLSNRQ